MYNRRIECHVLRLRDEIKVHHVWALLPNDADSQKNDRKTQGEKKTLTSPV